MSCKYHHSYPQPPAVNMSFAWGGCVAPKPRVLVFVLLKQSFLADPKNISNCN